MTICIPSLKTKRIPSCVDEIVIGQIKLPDTAVLVYLKDITTGLLDVFQTTSSNEGKVTIDTTQMIFAENHSYELWITLAGAGIEDKEEITIGTETCSTIELNFQDVKQDGETFPYATATIETA